MAKEIGKDVNAQEDAAKVTYTFRGSFFSADSYPTLVAFLELQIESAID